MTIQDKFATIPNDAQVSVLWAKGAAEFICDAGQIKRAMAINNFYDSPVDYPPLIAAHSSPEVGVREVGSVVVPTVVESPVRREPLKRIIDSSTGHLPKRDSRMRRMPIGVNTPHMTDILCEECGHSSPMHRIGIERRCAMTGCSCRIPMIDGKLLNEAFSRR